MRRQIRLNSEERRLEASVDRYVPVKPEKRSKCIIRAKKATVPF